MKLLHFDTTIIFYILNQPCTYSRINSFDLFYEFNIFTRR